MEWGETLWLESVSLRFFLFDAEKKQNVDNSSFKLLPFQQRCRAIIALVHHELVFSILKF